VLPTSAADWATAFGTKIFEGGDNRGLRFCDLLLQHDTFTKHA
jgi:hypothetical protein